LSGAVGLQLFPFGTRWMRRAYRCGSRAMCSAPVAVSGRSQKATLSAHRLSIDRTRRCARPAPHRTDKVRNGCLASGERARQEGVAARVRDTPRRQERELQIATTLHTFHTVCTLIRSCSRIALWTRRRRHRSQRKERLRSLGVHCSLRSLRLALVSRCLPHSLAGERRACSLTRPGQRRSLAPCGGARFPDARSFANHASRQKPTCTLLSDNGSWP
jgi:hypothetical protein